ncbi:MAG: SLAP domain-containing protein [Bacilli bacterium]
MKNLFSNWLTKEEAKEEAIPSLFANEPDTGIKPKLSLHPDHYIDPEDRFVFSFLNRELPGMEYGQLQLSPIRLEKFDDLWVATAFVRHTLDRAITLTDVTIGLVDADGKVFVKGLFPLGDVGELPPNSARPHTFEFEVSSFAFVPENTDGWALAFIERPKHELLFHSSWDNALTEDAKRAITERYEQLDDPQDGSLNFVKLQVNRLENGNISVWMFMRNGTENNLSLESLPLELVTADGEVVAACGFRFEDLTLRENSTTPWQFIFPADAIGREVDDWRAVSVRLKQ